MINATEPRVLKIGIFEIPIPPPKTKYQILMVGTISIHYEVP
jgi:hypothetical protein